MSEAMENGGKAALGVEESRRYLGGIGRSTFLKLPIRHMKIGKRRLYLIKDLDQYLQAHMVES